METNRTEHQWLSRLEANRSELAALARSVQNARRTGAGATAEDPPTSDHTGSMPSGDLASKEAMLRLLAENLDQVERAVGRLQVGLYGYCEDCGQRIPDDRLRFRPEATRCVHCQSKAE